MSNEKIKVVAMSDLHGHLPKNVPQCDVVCIAGDIIPLDVQRSLVRSISWLLLDFKPWADSLPCDKVIFVAGNHDFVFEELGPNHNNTGADVMKILFGRHKKDTKLVYLQDSSYEYKGKRFYGTPWIQDLSDWAFYGDDNFIENKWSNIPKRFDVFISHMPPRRSGLGQVFQPGWNYGNDYGSQALAEVLGTRNIKYALCGHVHSGQHSPVEYNGCQYVNVSLKDEDYNVNYDMFEFEV
jgi:Icc-related predicted phosphoesterase